MSRTWKPDHYIPDHLLEAIKDAPDIQKFYEDHQTLCEAAARIQWFILVKARGLQPLVTHERLAMAIYELWRDDNSIRRHLMERYLTGPGRKVTLEIALRVLTCVVAINMLGILTKWSEPTIDDWVEKHLEELRKIKTL